jgi:Arginine decarboxylase helical bundle domain
VLDNVIPETGALCEAYNDAVYFKCAWPSISAACKCSQQATGGQFLRCSQPSQCADLRRDEALRAFKLGILSLGERAEVDLLFEATCGKVPADLLLQDQEPEHALPIPQYALQYHVQQDTPSVPEGNIMSICRSQSNHCCCPLNRSTMWPPVRV